MALHSGEPRGPAIAGPAAVGAAVVGLLVVVALGLLAWFLFSGSDDPDQTGIGTTFEVPDGPPTPVRADRIRVSASSFLPPDLDAELTYGPENLLDGDLATAWNSATDEQQGRGQVLTFRFSEPVDLQGIRFVNGYAKNKTVFAANHRIKDVIVRTDGVEQPISLVDIVDEQEVSFDFGLTSKVEIEVSEIYPGDGFLDSTLTTDLALTEISFIAVQR